MRPPRDLDLGLPKSRRWPLLALAASVGAHALLLLFGVIEARFPILPRRPPRAEVVPPDTVPIVFFEAPPPKPQRPERKAERVMPRARVEPRPRNEPAPVVTPPPLAERPRVAAADTGAAPAAGPPRAIGRIGPGLADGKLWVRPLPLPPRELAQRLSKTHAELVDSAVTAVVQAYLDSIAMDPASRGAELPSWTTNIAGKKFGLDAKNIYIAGLKIPAAVLALLPIPAGNIDQNRAYSHMMELRRDIQQAAQRADNLEEFKQRIREIRIRKEQEEEFRRNQRTPPPPLDTLVAGDGRD